MISRLLLPVFFLFFFLADVAIAQTPVAAIDTKHTVAQLQEDFNILRTCLEQHSPALYLYTDKAELDQQFDELYNGLKQPMTGIEFYRHIAPILEAIGNGHTEIEIPQSYKDATQSSLPRLPFGFYYDRGLLFILSNGSDDESIVPKTLVRSINGTASSELMKEFKRYVTRDGINQSLPESTASSLFSYFYARIKGTPAQYEMEVKTPDGKERTVIVKGLKLAAIRANNKKRTEPSPRSFWQDATQPAISLEIDKDKAKLTIKTFDSKTAKKRGQPFKSFLNESFAKINASGVKHLILDLRGNGGGDPMPTVELFSHIYDQPFTFYKEVSAITNKFKNAKHYEYPIWLLNLQAKLKLKKQGDKYIVKGMDGTKEAQPAKDIFKGQLYVLTDPSSFSATGEMSAIIKEHTNAIFIGEEAGGNPNQNTSGIMLPLVLPNTKVKAVIPVILWKMNVTFENTGRGIVPDVELRPTINDKLNKVDIVMKYTEALIRQKAKS